MAGKMPSGLAAPVTDAVLLQLRQELDAAVAELPGALTSSVPELMVDFLATVFLEQDAQPVAREPMGDCTGTWSLLQGYLSDDPDSAAVVEDLQGMSRAADLARAAIADIRRLEIVSTQNLGHLDPRRYRNGGSGSCGLVTCSVCKRIMLAGRFKAHGPRCRGPPKKPQPPPPKVPAKRASLGSGAPQPKRPRGRGRPPPGKSKLSISGKPAPAALPPLSTAAAADGLSLQAPWRAAPGGLHTAALPPVYGAQQTQPPLEVRVEVVPSLQQTVEAGAAPSRRRRSALPRKPRNVEGLAFQSPSPPPAAVKQPSKRITQQSAGALAKRGRPQQEQQPVAPSYSGWLSQQQAQPLPQPATLATAPRQHQQAQQQWRQQQPVQGAPMQAAYAVPGVQGLAAAPQWTAQQQHAVAGPTLQHQQQMQQALPRGGGWVRQVPTSAPAVSVMPASVAGTAVVRQSQAQAQLQGQHGAAPQHVPLSLTQQAQLQQLQAKVLQQERVKRWAQLSPQQRQQLMMQHNAKKAALAQGGTQQLGNGQQLPAPGQGPGQPAVLPQHHDLAPQASGVAQLAPAPRQQQVLLSPQQMAQQQQRQQLLAQQQAHQRQQQQQAQQGQPPFQGHVQLLPQAQQHVQQQQQQQQHLRQQMLQRQQQQQQAGGAANGVSPQLALGQSLPQQLRQPHQQQYLQPQALQAQHMQQPAGSSGGVQTLLAPAAAAQFSYPAVQTAPPHLVNMPSASGVPPVRSPTFGGPAPGRTLAEQHFRSTDPSALQAVAAQGMPPAKTYSSLKTLSAQLPELATPTGSVPPYAQL